MAGSNARPPASAESLGERSEAERQAAAEYIASLLEGLRLVAHQAEMPVLSYLISVALEEANDHKSARD